MARPDEIQEAVSNNQQPNDNVWGQVAVENQTAEAAPEQAETKLTFNADNFDKIGPKAAEVLKAAGVSEISITRGPNGDHVDVKLDKALEIEQDPAKDGCNKLVVGKNLSADITKGKDGELSFDNIKGLKAETNLGVANVTNISLKRNEDGKTEITSTGRKGIFSRTRTREKEGEIMDKAEAIFDRLGDMFDKQGGGDAPATKKDTSNQTGYLDFSAPIYGTHASTRKNA
jgi:hypothetical protein